jgi:hypothetical protein
MGTDWFRTEFVNGSVNQEERRNSEPGCIPRTSGLRSSQRNPKASIGGHNRESKALIRGHNRAPKALIRGHNRDPKELIRGHNHPEDGSTS